MPDLQQLAVIFVFVSNGLILVALTWVLWRLGQSAQDTRSMVAEACTEMISAGRGLQGLGRGAERMIERLASAERQAAAIARVVADAATESMSHFNDELMFKLQQLLRDINGKDGLSDTLARDVRELLHSMRGLEPARFGDWEQSKRSEIDQVMAHSDLLSAENEQLRQRIEDMQQRMRVMRQPDPAPPTLAEASDALQASLAEQRQKTAQAREAAQDAEARIGQLVLDAERLRAEYLLNEQASAENEADLRHALEFARIDAARLTQELERLRADMGRMQVEKDFIEEKFLGLDADADADAAVEADAAANAVPAPLAV